MTTSPGSSRHGSRRPILWALAGIGTFLWGTSVLGVAMRLADKGNDAWWILIPLAAIPIVGLTVAGLRAVHPAESARDASRAGLGDRIPLTPLVDSLTAREMEVLALLQEGCTNRGIAERLFISQATVKTHVNAICRKLDAGNRTEAVARARNLGILA